MRLQREQHSRRLRRQLRGQATLRSLSTCRSPCPLRTRSRPFPRPSPSSAAATVRTRPCSPQLQQQQQRPRRPTLCRTRPCTRKVTICTCRSPARTPPHAARRSTPLDQSPRLPSALPVPLWLPHLAPLDIRPRCEPPHAPSSGRCSPRPPLLRPLRLPRSSLVLLLLPSPRRIPGSRSPLILDRPQTVIRAGWTPWRACFPPCRSLFRP